MRPDALVELELKDEPGAEEMNRLLMRLMDGVNAQAFRALGNRVLSGPFAGMIIPERTPWEDGNASTKLVGSYEHELHTAVGTALWRRPEAIINVGCAEGYYAVGMARLLRDATVWALDKSRESLDVCCDYAEKNGVTERVILCHCVGEAVSLEVPEAPGRRLYIVDCEGDELPMVDPQVNPRLAASDIIVECHDFLNPRISSTIAERFEATHKVELIQAAAPRLDQFPFLRYSPTVMALLTIVEKRPMPTCWLACWATTKRG